MQMGRARAFGPRRTTALTADDPPQDMRSIVSNPAYLTILMAYVKSVCHTTASSPSLPSKRTPRKTSKPTPRCIAVEGSNSKTSRSSPPPDSRLSARVKKSSKLHLPVPVAGTKVATIESESSALPSTGRAGADVGDSPGVTSARPPSVSSAPAAAAAVSTSPSKSGTRGAINAAKTGGSVPRKMAHLLAQLEFVAELRSIRQEPDAASLRRLVVETFETFLKGMAPKPLGSLCVDGPTVASLERDVMDLVPTSTPAWVRSVYDCIEERVIGCALICPAPPGAAYSTLPCA